jgi:hypothetical protein
LSEEENFVECIQDKDYQKVISNKTTSSKKGILKQQSQNDEVTCLNDMPKAKKKIVSAIHFAKEESIEMVHHLQVSEDKEKTGSNTKKLPLKSPKASIHERHTESDMSMGSIEGELNSAKKKMMVQFGVSTTFDVSKLAKKGNQKDEKKIGEVGVQQNLN